MFASWSSAFWQPLMRSISIPNPKRLKNQIFFMVIQKKVKEIHFHYAFFDRNCKDKVRKECQDVFPFLSLLFSFLSLELCRPWKVKNHLSLELCKPWKAKNHLLLTSCKPWKVKNHLMPIPCRMRTPQAHNVRRLLSQGAKKELPLFASLSREEIWESRNNPPC